MGFLRILALTCIVSLTSCGAMRFLFASEKEGEPSRVQQAAKVIAENGTDPGKWLGWIIGGAVAAGGATGYAGGRVHGRDRRSGRDRRGELEPRVAGEI